MADKMCWTEPRWSGVALWGIGRAFLRAGGAVEEIDGCGEADAVGLGVRLWAYAAGLGCGRWGYGRAEKGSRAQGVGPG